VTLDFRPITLLFGANSAGKSTVMDAMDYLHAILETQSPIPDLHSDKWQAGFARLVDWTVHSMVADPTLASLPEQTTS